MSEDDSDYETEDELYDSALIEQTESREEALSATSPLTESTVYRGPKGKHHRKHSRPRSKKEKNLTRDFIALCCDNNVDTFDSILDRYEKLEEGDNLSREQASGMLGTFYEMGAKERMLREVFGIGSSRYQRIVAGLAPRPRGGKNVFSVTETMISSIAEMVEKLPTEEGFPCGHRRLMTYCIDPSINTWAKLYEYYESFIKDKACRKMGYSTFHNYIRSYHPDLRLKRLQEDVCDCCVTLKTGSLNVNVNVTVHINSY